jgi:hypothetical protein
MHLSWNEIRVRAARFSDAWRDAKYEKGETHSFYNAFFDVFGIQQRKVYSFEVPVKKLGNKQGFIDLFWKGVLLVEHKSAGRDLVKAKTQALDYFPGLKDAELPRYILLSDFQNFELYDLEEGTEALFPLNELHANIEHFGFILGIQKRTFRDQDPVNILASQLMARLHDGFKASGYIGHDLERLLVRLVFCLFADDTGIFARDIFLDLIVERSSVDGSDTGRLLNELFDVLNTPEDKRQKRLDESLARFPYINGELFSQRLPTPAFDSSMRALLVEACEFNWDAISPAIFGSLFQSVMDKKERRSAGAHYTTEKNIMKVIQPLFLDELRAEFIKIKESKTGRSKALLAFHDRLAELTFFDPACGCGNFLIIAYRELRSLEIEILRELNPKNQRELDIATLSKIDVNQFYGIEIGEFAARIAETALWMMDHIMNNRLSLEFGQVFARIPLKTSPHIHFADALELDWTKVLDPKLCSYVLGNPPFIGFVMRDKGRQNQASLLMQKLGASGKRLDYVAAWFLKAGAYVQVGDAKIGFVATNSITQGEQVQQLWPTLFARYKLDITFAHRTFAWGSDAAGKAHVHVVIIGLAKSDKQPLIKRLFSYKDMNELPEETTHNALTAYLVSADNLINRHLVINRTALKKNNCPKICVGSKPVDDGHYILDDAERIEFLKKEPDCAKGIRPFIGGREYINGENRWIIVADVFLPNELRALPLVMERIASVRHFRENSDGNLANALSITPTKFHVTVIPEKPFLCIPETSSERREYVPIGWLNPPTIPSNAIHVIQDATLWHFGILTSKMHMAWLRHIGGRLKSDYRYSGGIVYNTFPWPEVTPAAKTKISTLAQAVLDARAGFGASTLADLYDPDTMPLVLRKAHQALDKAVDKVYRAPPFANDRERVEHLFALYEKLTAPLTVLAAQKPKRIKRIRL